MRCERPYLYILAIQLSYTFLSISLFEVIIELGSEHLWVPEPAESTHEFSDVAHQDRKSKRRREQLTQTSIFFHERGTRIIPLRPPLTWM
jgi:hypothetical protein